jgi:hypothetical protein
VRKTILFGALLALAGSVKAGPMGDLESASGEVGLDRGSITVPQPAAKKMGVSGIIGNNMEGTSGQKPADKVSRMCSHETDCPAMQTCSPYGICQPGGFGPSQSGACTSLMDCHAGNNCVNGHCSGGFGGSKPVEEVSRMCSHETDCPAMQTCSPYGICQPGGLGPTQGGACYTIMDCHAGNNCVNGHCKGSF